LIIEHVCAICPCAIRHDATPDYSLVSNAIELEVR